jgi:hypothetical protein
MKFSLFQWLPNAGQDFQQFFLTYIPGNLRSTAQPRSACSPWATLQSLHVALRTVLCHTKPPILATQQERLPNLTRFGPRAYCILGRLRVQIPPTRRLAPSAWGVPKFTQADVGVALKLVPAHLIILRHCQRHRTHTVASPLLPAHP